MLTALCVNKCIDKFVDEITKSLEEKESVIKASEAVKIIEDVCRQLISKYEKIVQVIEDKLIGTNKIYEPIDTIKICEKLLTFDEERMKMVKQASKLLLLFYFFNVEWLIRSFINVGDEESKDKKMLMKKHSDVLSELKLTNEYKQLFLSDFKVDHLSNFLPATTPVDIIKIIIDYTHYNIYDIVGDRSKIISHILR
jgi:hypothetical protein